MASSFFYNACPVEVSPCPQRPATHIVVRFWFSSPAPYAMIAIAREADAELERTGSEHARCAWHEGHPDDRRQCLVVTIASRDSIDATSQAKAVILGAADRARAVAEAALSGVRSASVDA